MRSSLSKHIWLIQSQDPLPVVTPIDATGGETVRFSPSWELMCLQSFILERTGHTCSLIDVRITETLAGSLQKLSGPDPHSDGVAVIFTTIDHLGPVGSVIAYIHQHFPDIIITLCGPFVDSFPESIRLIPHVDFGLCGDPENILRNLLDFIDIEHRLSLVPGLIKPDSPSKSPHWMPNLQALSLPEWYRVIWNYYQSHDSMHILKAEARLSRGNPGTSFDCALSSPREPVRQWNFAAMAQSFQKCAGQGISEIFLEDPPGFWTDEHIADWCRHLYVFRNTQPWAIRLIPRDLPDSVLNDLAENSCHRIEFIIPTCDQKRNSLFGINITLPAFRNLLEKLTNRNIRPQVIYWIHGPGESKNEADRIYNHMISLHYPKFALYPFPVNHDSNLYEMIRREGGNPPPLTDWIAWAQKPAISPTELWGGISDLAECRKTIQTVQKRIMRSPYRHMSRIMRRMRLNSSIANLEKRLVSLFNRKHHIAAN